MKLFSAHLYKIFSFCLLLLLIASCKSSAPGSSSSGIKSMEEIKIMEEVIKNSPSFETFSSKMRLTAVLGGKETSVNGSLKMKRNELIQLSVAPILGIEVARIEITKDSVLILDRINRQYIYVPISALSFLANGDMNFYTIQALFFNELFLPGNQKVTDSDIPAFSLKKDGDKLLIKSKKTKKIDYRFTADEESRLINTRISAYSKYTLDWKYNEFKTLNREKFPSRMNIDIQGAGKPMKAQMELSKMETGKISLSRTSVSKKYKQIATDELLKRLFNL